MLSYPLDQEGKLFPIEIKKMAAPPKKLTKVFELIGKSPLERGTGAVLCMADRLGAFDQDNLIVPISLILVRQTVLDADDNPRWQAR